MVQHVKVEAQHVQDTIATLQQLGIRQPLGNSWTRLSSSERVCTVGLEDARTCWNGYTGLQ